MVLAINSVVYPHRSYKKSRKAQTLQDEKLFCFISDFYL